LGIGRFVLDEIIKSSKDPIVNDVDELMAILTEFSADYPGIFPWVLIPAEMDKYQVIKPDQSRTGTTLIPTTHFEKLLQGDCCNFVTDKEKLPEACCEDAEQWDGALLQRFNSRKDGEIYLVMGLTGIAGHELIREQKYRVLIAPLMSIVLKGYINMKAADRDASKLKLAH